MLDILRKAVNSGRSFASWTKLRLGGRASHKRESNAERDTSRQELKGRSPHLLLLAWSFPPEVNGGVYRPVSLVKYAVKAGWRVTVVSGPLNGQEGAAGIELLNSLPAGVAVFRALPAPPTSYRLLPKVDGGFQNIAPVSQAAVAACQYHPPTVVLASGPPFLTFISAYFVAKKFRVPLVLDYRDEWSIHTPQFVTASAFDKEWERRLLRAASAVVFATDATRDVYLAAINGLDASKCFVVSNGWDPDDFSGEPVASPRNSARGHDKFVISFVGSTGFMADPGAFLARFQEVMARCPSLRERLLLRFTGPKADELRGAFTSFQNQFQDSIELVDGVTKPAAVAEMRRADALLLLLKPFYDTTMPGKLYEYLAAGAPILVFGDTGLAASLVRRLGAGLVVPADDTSALEAALHRLLEEPGEHWETADRRSWIAGHTRSAQATRMLKLLSETQ
jgi:glycosyltransferase involved in cell wall biosynthesis